MTVEILEANTTESEPPRDIRVNGAIYGIVRHRPEMSNVDHQYQAQFSYGNCCMFGWGKTPNLAVIDAANQGLEVFEKAHAHFTDLAQQITNDAG